MANITLNNISNPSILTFTDVPNILKVSEEITGGKSLITLTFSGDMSSLATGNSQYQITVLDETIENVIDARDANSRRFVMKDAVSTAASVANALRNCASLYADFTITYNSGNVYITAREIGSKLNVVQPVSTNIPSSNLTYSLYDGSTSSNLTGGKIIVKVNESGQEITTLVKNWHGNSVSFDVSPVLATFAEYGTCKPYTLIIDKMGNDASYQNIGNVNSLVTYGYMAGHSNKYLPITNRILLQDYKHYTFYNTITVSVLSPSQSASVAWTAYTSNMKVLGNGSSENYPVNGYMADITITIPTNVFSDSYFVDLSYGGQTIRFDVIKPIKASEGATRLLWRNEYGGIEFADFTGAVSESNSLSTDTYQENIYGLYDGTYKGERIYRSETERQTTLNTHLITRLGTMFAYGLEKSKLVWTVEDGETIYVIPQGVEIVENQTHNDIYTVTVRIKK